MATSMVWCSATINHIGDTEAVAVETDILNGRVEAPTLAEEGFELRTLPSAVQDWTDAAEVERIHHPEIADWVRTEVGCDSVAFYPGIVRSPAAAERSSDLGPIEAAHSDYSESYRSMLATAGHPYLDILAPSMAAADIRTEQLAQADRIVTLQFWRNIGPTEPDRPLAFCDGRTVGRDEFMTYVVESYGGIPSNFESLLLAPPTDDRRRWMTFPAMTADEVVVFRAYDSDRAATGEPYWTPHSAFADPTVGSEAPQRESFEIRAICLFGVD